MFRLKQIGIFVSCMVAMVGFAIGAVYLMSGIPTAVQGLVKMWVENQ